MTVDPDGGPAVPRFSLRREKRSPKSDFWYTLAWGGAVAALLFAILPAIM